MCCAAAASGVVGRPADELVLTTTTMSFFRRVNSDSESSSSDSDEESLLSSSEDEAPKPQQKKNAFMRSDSDSDSDDSDDSNSDDDSEGSSDEEEGAAKKNRFLRGGADSDDDSDEDAPKVLKSARQKRAEELTAAASGLNNARRINDWASISRGWDEIVRLADRQRALGEPVGPIFIQTLAELDTLATEAKPKKKQMNATNARALNTVSQKLRKMIREHDKDVSAFREDPEAYTAKAEAAITESEAPPPPIAPVHKPAGAVGVRFGAPVVEPTAEADDGFETVGRGGKSMAISSEGLFKTMAAIMEARGRKTTDRVGQIATLEALAGVASGAYQKIRVQLALLAIRFDYNSTNHAYLPVDRWEAARKDLLTLLDILSKEPAYVISDVTPEYDDEEDRQPNVNGEASVVAVRGNLVSFVERLDDEFNASLRAIDPHTPEYVERLADEKRLYAIILRSQLYFELREQGAAIERVLARRLEHVYAKQEPITQALERAVADTYASAAPFVSKVTPAPGVIAAPNGSGALVRALCTCLYASQAIDAERIKTRAMLCQVYHVALHGRYHGARDLFLMSHLQEAIHRADAATQILYNRAVAQLGAAAFRAGAVKDAQAALQDLFVHGRARELLAQGAQRASERNQLSPEQEAAEKRLAVPFHLHINLELLEAIYLTASMLLEIPHLARASASMDPEAARRRVISRPLRRMLDYADRQVFSGPPENMRDHVIAASRALQGGDWAASTQLIREISIWSLLPDQAKVLAKLDAHIQAAGIRTWLFSYAAHYETLSLVSLATQFGISLGKARALVSKMIWSDELPSARLDAVDNVVRFTLPAGSSARGAAQPRLHPLASSLADKAAALLETNEKTLAAELQRGAQATGGAAPENQGVGERRRRGGPAARGGRGTRNRNQFTRGFPGQIAA